MTQMPFAPELLAYARAGHAAPPPYLGTRYDTAGVFQHEPGNTTVAHVLPGSATEAALVEAGDRYRAMPEAPLFAFTPVSSLHMTLFQGIIDSRRLAGYWPPDLPLDTPIDEMTRQMGGRLSRLTPRDNFAVAVVGARPSGIIVAGASEADRRRMQDWRDALADVWGYRHPDHESYVFHITFCYPIAWLEAAALPRWQAMLDEVAVELRRRAPVLELRPTAFCAFSDMNHFEELRPLPFR